ncbi:DoxX family protein [Fimbriiglobus ruber]|uniref:DoxX family protein n=1 Tax=Fimbriiglobus ruber TaxID=1908690 RepID=A0A225DYI3_9BACT|nr:DoxX family protein [Fimbriiglobus ruber]OWK43598.1 hypothetical protein FRUB_03197 [Fimbriiglobus ruber]
MTFTKIVRRESETFSPSNVALWGASLIIGLSFALLGGAKFLLPWAADQLAVHGIPTWVRFPVGTAEVVGGLMFLVPAVRLSGAGVLASVLVGGIATHVALEGVDATVVPFVGLLALIVLISWGLHRAAWWSRYATALDQFTARENLNDARGVWALPGQE